MVNLVCEDASHLGGPMGSEYTTHVFTKTYSTIDIAKRNAIKYQGSFPKWAKWEKQKDGRITCDSGAYIWTIKEIKVEE